MRRDRAAEVTRSGNLNQSSGTDTKSSKSDRQEKRTDRGDVSANDQVPKAAPLAGSRFKGYETDRVPVREMSEQASTASPLYPSLP